MTGTTGRPRFDEFTPFNAGYVANVTEIDPIGVMESQGLASQASLAAISEEQSLFRYAPDKWSIRNLRGIANNARVSVRALAFIVPGHERHYLNVLRERYGIGGN